ncbi:MAG: 2'-5' RNA ligase family protein [Promethearchaeota archaeon]|jgi:2'-5' RNA ligase
MSKVYYSAVVVIPPEEKWAAIQEIRKRYDRNINRWMPHITLLYPFRPPAQYSNVEEIFSKTCGGLSPFEISLNFFKYFGHGHQTYTLWLNPEPNNSLIDLQSEILKIVPDCNDVNKYKNGFKPHLSVGQIKGKNLLLEILKNLQREWKEIKFTLNKIFFISREKSKTSKFKISKQFQFKEE